MSQRKSRARTRAEDRILEITSRADRGSRSVPSKLPDPYRRLLSEASDPARLNGPPAKRRKVGGGQRPTRIEPAAVIDVDARSGVAVTDSILQTVVDSDESGEDSDFHWQEVDVTPVVAEPEAPRDQVAAVTLEVSPDVVALRQKRRGITAADKRLGRDCHKMHLLCLLFHAHIRNRWCSLQQVHANLIKIPSAKMVNLLHPNPSWIQLRQSDAFLEGLRLAMDLWQSRFRVTATGLRRARWQDDPAELEKIKNSTHENYESLDKTQFMSASRTLQGSQDLGNQLFCALLRAIGVEARLVCSLQPLPLTKVGAKPTTPQKARITRPRIYATFESDLDLASSADEGLVSGARPLRRPQRKFGQAELELPIGVYQQAALPPKRNKVLRLDYPVFWVEALNPAYQQWVAVDPIVTHTIARPTKLEPPASYEASSMSYVVAFSEDVTAKDVTRRYVKAFNAKTRKLRVESTTDGQKWYSTVLRPFKRRTILDQDQIENAEFSRKEAAEGLPNNIQDFREHPYYALERHLKRNEIIWPKREIGKINAGKSSSSKLEPIYRRSDVQTVQSADKWYRLGREIKHGEQPLKQVPSRARRDRSVEAEDEVVSVLTALYSFSQTELYIPPPVVGSIVPKNAYGNIDMYTPSMLPAGGAHVKHELAKRAAQLLGLDYADAVTGFKFQGRHGTAVVQGIVVALAYREAVQLVVDGFEQSVVDDENAIRSAECLRLWRRFLLGLEIARRIGLTDIYAKDDEKASLFRREYDAAANEQENVVEAGGFVPGADESAIDPPGSARDLEVHADTGRAGKDSITRGTATRRQKRRLIHDDSGDEGYDPSTAPAMSIRKATVGPHQEMELDTQQATGTPRDTSSSEHRTMAEEPVIDDWKSQDIAGRIVNSGEDDDDDLNQDRTDHDSTISHGSEDVVNPKDGSEDVVTPRDGSEDVVTPKDGPEDVVPPKLVHQGSGGPSECVPKSSAIDGVEHGDLTDARSSEAGSAAGGILHQTEQASMPGDESIGGGFVVDDGDKDCTGDLVPDPDTLAKDGSSTSSSMREHAGDTASNSDGADSMLSHDPEDDDADPDWLEAA